MFLGGCECWMLRFWMPENWMVWSWMLWYSFIFGCCGFGCYGFGWYNFGRCEYSLWRRFWMFFGGYERWMLRFGMLRKLDATLLDASILTRCWVRICLIHSYASSIIFCGWMNAFSTGSTVVPTMQRPPDHPLTSLTRHCSGSQANAIARGGISPPPWLTPEPRSVAKQARRRSKGSTRRIER